MLSLETADNIGIIAAIAVMVAFFFLSYSNSKQIKHPYGKRTTFVITITSLIVSLLLLIYAFISMSSYSKTDYQVLAEQVKQTYGISLTPEQSQSLLELKQNTSEQKLYSSVEVKGRELVAIWNDTEIQLMEYKNGKLTEISKQN